MLSSGSNSSPTPLRHTTQYNVLQHSFLPDGNTVRVLLSRLVLRTAYQDVSYPGLIYYEYNQVVSQLRQLIAHFTLQRSSFFLRKGCMRFGIEEVSLEQVLFYKIIPLIRVSYYYSTALCV